jgi:DNA primase
MDTFDAIKQRIPLQLAIQRYTGIPLIQEGQRFKGICPFHKENTSSFFVFPNTQRYYCFGCAAAGDIFEFVRCYFGIEKPIEQLQRVSEDFIDDTNISMMKPRDKEIKDPVKKNDGIDFLQYYRKAHSNVNHTDYWQQRGLTLDTVRRFMLGYDQRFIHPNYWDRARPLYVAAYAVVPVTRYSFTALAVNKNSSVKKMRAGTGRLFNLKMYKSATGSIFVTEAEVCAMTFVQAGFTAISIGGVQGANTFLKFVKDNKPQNRLVIALDDDQTGWEANNKLCTGLTQLGISFLSPQTLYGEFKDANEFFVRDPHRFIKVVREVG